MFALRKCGRMLQERPVKLSDAADVKQVAAQPEKFGMTRRRIGVRSGELAGNMLLSTAESAVTCRFPRGNGN